MFFKDLFSKFKNLYYRLELVEEANRLKKLGRYLPKDYLRLIFKLPNTYDDFINILCFIDNNIETNLIDVGGNEGKFSKDFLKFFPNTNKIILFEPLKILNERIKKNLKEFENYEIINKGIGATIETKIIKYEKKNTSLASFKEHTDDVNKFYKNQPEIAERVEMTTLDTYKSFFQDKKQLILKIDTQGFELEALRGGGNLLQICDLVILECSFVEEYKGSEPSFILCAQILKNNDLYPIIFQDYGKKISNYAFERDVIFVKKNLLKKIFHNN